MRLSKSCSLPLLAAWNVPIRPALIWRTCWYSPRMHGLKKPVSEAQSGAPAAPNGAPTWPPWVTYLTTGQVLLDGCLPPPVVRQPGVAGGVQVTEAELEQISDFTGRPFVPIAQIDVVGDTSPCAWKLFAVFPGQGTVPLQSISMLAPASRKGTVNGNVTAVPFVVHDVPDGKALLSVITTFCSGKLFGLVTVNFQTTFCGVLCAPRTRFLTKLTPSLETSFSQTSGTGRRRTLALSELLTVLFAES